MSSFLGTFLDQNPPPADKRWPEKVKAAWYGQRLREVAEAGDLEAQRLFALLCHCPFACSEWLTVEPDCGVAATWLERLAEADRDPETQDELGRLYETGGVRLAPDAAKAARWIRAAAEQGYLPAQLRLARFHSRGFGVPRDPVAAAAAYRATIAAGSLDGVCALTDLLLNDPALLRAGGEAEAVSLLRMAVEQERDCNARRVAALRLARLHAEGRGVAKSFVDAYFWLTVAGGPEAGELLDRVIDQMSDAEIQEAELRIPEGTRQQCRLDGGGAGATRPLLPLFGLDQIATRKDDPALWEAVVRRYWPTPYGPELQRLGVEIHLFFGTARWRIQGGWISDHDPVLVQTWRLVRSDVRRLRPVGLHVARVMDTWQHCVRQPQPGRYATISNIHIAQPSLGVPKAVVFWSKTEGPMNYASRLAYWQRDTQGIWVEGELLSWGLG